MSDGDPWERGLWRGSGAALKHHYLDPAGSWGPSGEQIINRRLLCAGEGQCIYGGALAKRVPRPDRGKAHALKHCYNVMEVNLTI